jgi:transcriptional regulator with XRE-family HTH domain
MSPTDLIKTLSHRLKLIRDHRGWTQEQAARHIGIPKAQISHYECKILPTLTNLKRLADGYDCSIDWLVGRSNQMETEQ